MIPVYVRDIDKEDGVYLGEFTIQDVGRLPQLFSEFAISNQKHELVYHCSQFVLTDFKIGFEIVVEKPGE